MFQLKYRQKYYMRNSAGIVADGDQDRHSRKTPRTIQAHFAGNLETIRAGNTGHGFIKHLPRLRDHTARNTAGDPQPIRADHAAGKRKL